MIFDLRIKVQNRKKAAFNMYSTSLSLSPTYSAFRVHLTHTEIQPAVFIHPSIHAKNALHMNIEGKREQKITPRTITQTQSYPSTSKTLQRLRCTRPEFGFSRATTGKTPLYSGPSNQYATRFPSPATFLPEIDTIWCTLKRDTSHT